ncbi:hypothetical protein HDU79_007794, partial [Rhizoclosmatium sp. JEL0117]
MTFDDAAGLAAFILQLRDTFKTQDEAELELAEVMPSAKDFVAWVYEYLENDAKKVKEGDCLEHPDHHRLTTAHPSASLNKTREIEQSNTASNSVAEAENKPSASGKRFAPIVWDLPEPKKDAVVPPPAKRVAVDSEEARKQRMARFGIVEEPSKPPAAVPTPATKSVGIVGRGTGTA